MITQEIRRKFLDYFKKKGHAIIASSPVVPHDDPTLLFINAGMNQFKDVFLGKSIRDYDIAATCQKCIRVGGKHNDLDNVGHTSRHLTFFEMLGNFSFGAYFKKEAIEFAWEVSTQVFGFDEKFLWPTVFQNDDESVELWKKYVPIHRITRFGEKDNFWAMGETGPCGPCSEIYYDRGENFGPAKNPTEDTSGERYLEFWNLVFMQFNKDASGVMHPLPKPSIDTGAGIERVVSLKMNVDSLFETDIFKMLIARIENVSKVKYQKDNSPAFHVIADHLRSLSFAITDGAQPSNVDRGYVLRKVLRRAVRYGKMLGFEQPFLAKILPTLIETMGEDYHELRQAQDRIADLLTIEEENFFRTLKRGGNILNQIIANSHAHADKISGEDAFKLKDTYGLPLEEIQLLAKDSNLTVDLNRYEQLEKEAKERSRASRKTTDQMAQENDYAAFVKQNGSSQFVGYTQFETQAKVTGIFFNDTLCDVISEGEEGFLVLDRTPFYAEKGGQIGDQGTITGSDGIFEVIDCQNPFPGLILHKGKVKSGAFRLESAVSAAVNLTRRQKIANNHTATHLLHWALQELLGGHIKQAGSIVDDERLRFDFSHHKALTNQEIVQIEDLVNAKIRENQPVQSYELSYEEAQKHKDIKQFFGEKYGSKVRVIDIDYSKELCGGTHTSAVGNIGLFRIVKESSISAGIRRIEAVTGAYAEKLSQTTESQLDKLSSLLKVQKDQITDRVSRLLEENKSLQKEIEEFRKIQMENELQSLLSEIKMIGVIPVLIKEWNKDPAYLKEAAELLVKKSGSLAVIFATAQDEQRCSLLVRISSDLMQKNLKANEIVKTIAPLIEGSGGGKADFAQAGGKAPKKISEALNKAKQYIEELCSSKNS